MAYDFLYLTNRLCNKFNEVPLDASTFLTADGVYSEFKNAVNAAIKDIHTRKNCEWPFAWDEITFKTVIGQSEYAKDANAAGIDWDSFQLVKTKVNIDSITQSLGLATATVAAGHQLQDNDYVYLTGATQSDYNGFFYVNVSSPTQFTFAVSASAVSPATGTPAYFMPYPNRYLVFCDIDGYRQEGLQRRDNNAYITGQYNIPERVVRKSDNNIILTPKPDRIYTVQYESFMLPADLEVDSDIPVIPEVFKEVIVDAALWCIYMFRDNVEEAASAETKYEKSLENMARILIPQTSYMRVVD